MKRPVRNIWKTLVLGVLAAASVSALAQPYPNKPIKFVVAYGAGAGVDVAARMVAEILGEQVKTGAFVENREGAGGLIGTVAVAKSAPDGYTLLFASAPVTTSQLLTNPQPYDPVKDFVPVAQVVTNPLVLVASVNAPYKTFKELVAYIKANPGKVSYATSGKGSSSHLETELIKQHYGMDITDVPYKSFGPALTDTIADRVGFFLSAYGALLPHIKQGTVRALAIGTPKRSPLLPDVPTFAEEMGLPDYVVGVWYGVMAPAGTPVDVVAKLSGEIAKTMENPQLRDKIRASGADVSYLPQGQFSSVIRNDTERWTKVVKSIGFSNLQ